MAENAELLRENELFRRQKQEELDKVEQQKSADIIDKLQETVNIISYKKKYADLEHRYGQQEQLFEKRMREIQTKLNEAESNHLMLQEKQNK